MAAIASTGATPTLRPVSSILTSAKAPSQSNRGRPSHYAVAMSVANDKRRLAVAINPSNLILTYDVMTAVDNGPVSISRGPKLTRHVQFSPVDDHILGVAGQGGISLIDTRVPVDYSKMDFNGTILCRDDAHCVAFGCGGTLLCGGFEDGVIRFWDARSSNPLGVFRESHVDSVLTMQFHPRDPTKLISASADGTANLYEISAKNEEEALLMTWHPACDMVQSFFYVDRVRNVEMIGLISSTHRVSLWSVDEGNCVGAFQIQSLSLPVTLDYVVHVIYDERHDVFVIVAGKFGNHALFRLTLGASFEVDPSGAILDLGTLVRFDCELSDGHYALVRGAVYPEEGNTDRFLTYGEDAKICAWDVRQPGPEPGVVGKRKTIAGSGGQVGGEKGHFVKRRS